MDHFREACWTLMGRLLSYIVDDSFEGMRLDAVLAQTKCYESRNAASKAIEEGRVHVNGELPQKKKPVNAGDTIVYEVYDNLDTPVMGENIPLDIRYEDNDLIVLSKQPNMVCHPSESYREGTLVNALIYHCGIDQLCNIQGDNDRPGIVHRLDKDTTGLMMAAKSNTAGAVLMEGIRNKDIERRYLALVHGVIPMDSGLIDAPIDRSVSDRKKMAVRDTEHAREAVTSFQVIERFEPSKGNDGYTLVECTLYTGRTHQIRVHMQYIHHPLVGETAYDSFKPKSPGVDLGLGRQFLHSYHLTFEHPTTGERMHFSDNLPDDLQHILNKLATTSRGVTPYGCNVYDTLAKSPRPCYDEIAHN